MNTIISIIDLITIMIQNTINVHSASGTIFLVVINSLMYMLLSPFHLILISNITCDAI